MISSSPEIKHTGVRGGFFNRFNGYLNLAHVHMNTLRNFKKVGVAISRNEPHQVKRIRAVLTLRGVNLQKN
jgi:hypothetical protein